MNKLWKGLFKQKWILVYTVVVAILFSYWTFNYCAGVIYAFCNPSPESGGLTDTLKGIAFDTGTGNYMLIILLEVIIFHFAVQTLNVIKGENLTLSLKDFIQAQKRMMFIMLYSYIMGVVASTVLSVALGLIGIGRIKFIFMFFITAYFVGLSFLDNYNEQYKIRPKASRYIIWQYWPAALTLGVVCTALMAVPLIGPIGAPILGAVAATRYGHRVSMEKEIIPVKYLKKKERKELEKAEKQ